MTPTSPTPLNRGDLADTVRAGQYSLGTFIGMATPVSAEVCAASGFDWVLLDLEHGAGGEEQIRDVVPAAGSYGIPTLVRVEAGERIRIGRALDCGAAGIMLPRLNSAAEVNAVLTHLRYPPAGDRGVATYNRACRFGLDDIAAIDGVDVLFIGPRDLSHDLGVPGDITAPAYIEALDAVLAAARRHGKGGGMLVGDGAAAAARLAQGWSFIAIGSDSTLLAATIRTELGRARTPAA